MTQERRPYHRRIGNQKWCFVCKQYKNLKKFYKDSSQTSGWTSLCKSCHSKYRKDYLHRYYLAHREELLPKHRLTAKASYDRKLKRMNNPFRKLFRWLRKIK